MGLQSFERGLERMVDGVFRRSHNSIRPIELGRRLIREMDDHRTVDVKGQRVVPNDFQILLAADDHHGFADIEDALRTELVEAVREYAREEGYHFMGPVAVRLSAEDKMKNGRFTVTSLLKQGDGGSSMASIVLPSGQRIGLNQGTVTVGRLPECTISINDSNISRKHAEMRQSAGEYVVIDLNSTNGTLVNGIRITGQQRLNEGDIISFGSTHVRFEAS